MVILASPRPGAGGHRGSADIAAAEEFEQQNHLVLAIRDAVLLRLVESLDAVIQLRARPAVGLLGFENARAEEFGDILQFVGGKAQEKLARFTPLLVRNDRT